jgi:DNA segregation ATPase FtsK/SpoIIIE-like protein
VKPDTKIDSRVNVGDSIAAQLTSSGDAEAVPTLGAKPETTELAVPSKKPGDLRERHGGRRSRNDGRTVCPLPASGPG